MGKEQSFLEYLIRMGDAAINRNTGERRHHLFELVGECERHESGDRFDQRQFKPLGQFIAEPCGAHFRNTRPAARNDDRASFQ